MFDGPSSLFSGPHVKKNVLFGLGDKPMNLLHVLPLHRNKNEMMKEDGGKDGHLKVGEQVARTLSRAVGAKRTELCTPTSMGVARSKVVWVKPVQGGKCVVLIGMSVNVCVTHL